MSAWQVYLLGESLGGDNYCKIGMARSAEKRLRTLQTGNPRTLFFLGCWELPSYRAAYDVERKVIKQLCNGTAMGEWFQCPEQISPGNPNTIATVIERIIDALGYEVVDA